MHKFSKDEELNINLNITRPFKDKTDINLDMFWKGMQDFLENSNDKNVIILSIGGKHDHWSVIESISDAQINLIDSWKIKCLKRKYCTVSEAQKTNRIHKINPLETFFIQKL